MSNLETNKQSEIYDISAPSNQTPEVLDGKLDVAFNYADKNINTELSGIKLETKEKKDVLIKEYLITEISKYIVLNSLIHGKKPDFQFNEKNISILGITKELPVSLNKEDINTGIQKYIQKEYFETFHNKNNIIDYSASELKTDELSPQDIKKLSDSPADLLTFLEEKLGKGIRELSDLLGENFFKNLGLGIQARLYSETNNSAYLTNKGGFEDGVKNLVGEEYMQNYENANPLLKTTVVGGGSIYAAFKLFQWVNEKVSGKDGIGWFNLIFGGMAVELIGQVLNGKSLTGDVLKGVTEMFKGTDNAEELKKQEKLINENKDKVDLGNYKALTYLILGTGYEDSLNLSIDEIKDNADFKMVEFLCSQNGLSKEDLYKKVLEGHKNIVGGIEKVSGIKLTPEEIQQAGLENSGAGYSGRMIELLNRATMIEKKVNELNNLGATVKTIYEENNIIFKEYLIGGDESKLTQINGI